MPLPAPAPLAEAPLLSRATCSLRLSPTALLTTLNESGLSNTGPGSSGSTGNGDGMDHDGTGATSATSTVLLLLLLHCLAPRYILSITSSFLSLVVLYLKWSL